MGQASRVCDTRTVSLLVCRGVEPDTLAFPQWCETPCDIYAEWCAIFYSSIGSQGAVGVCIGIKEEKRSRPSHSLSSIFLLSLVNKLLVCTCTLKIETRPSSLRRIQITTFMMPTNSLVLNTFSSLPFPLLFILAL